MGDRLGSLIGVNVLCVFVGWKWPCVIGVGDVLSGVLTDVRYIYLNT